VEKQRTLSIIPPMTVRFASEVELFAPGATREVGLELTAYRPKQHGQVAVLAPEGWQVSPAQSVDLAAIGERTLLRFKVTAPAHPNVGRLTASVRIGEKVYAHQRVEVRYRHIPLQLLHPAARLRAVSLEITKQGQRVGYVPGAGDTVAESLRQIGYDVTILEPAKITPEVLRGFDAVVVGVRALNTRADLSTHVQELFDYVANGGTLVMQYNNPNGLKVDRVAPYSLKISPGRVTDENAVMTMLEPQHPVFNTPNKITAADFEGWVQERGLYFPGDWGPEFTPLLACNDAGEAPLKGSLLVTKHGRGHFVYTGLAFFRQLPAGVPGAYRLFANIVSLGK
jgi:hypothetical protein